MPRSSVVPDHSPLSSRPRGGSRRNARTRAATIGSPDRVLNPAAPMAFVGTLLGMLAAFTLAWVYLMIRRYQLARAETARGEAARLDHLVAARRVQVARG